MVKIYFSTNSIYVLEFIFINQFLKINYKNYAWLDYLKINIEKVTPTLNIQHLHEMKMLDKKI